jgi:hypothetical protein
MPRLMLTDEHWSKLRTIMRERGIYDKPSLRKTVEVESKRGQVQNWYRFY